MTDIHINIQHKSYADRTGNGTTFSISDFQLSLYSHEFVCLFGQSGCGKTTLLNTIAGLDTQFKGEILVGAQHLQPSIGYVFQNPRLLPWRTVRQNIELALADRPLDGAIDFLLEVMQLTAVQHDYPERLSLGMSRRVAIIRAFALNPDVLLMDEPFVSLDAPTARQVRQLLIDLWQQRPHTVLFVTHDLREAIALADRLIFLSSAPLRIAADIPIACTRTARDDSMIESFRQQLLHQYPVIQALL